MSLATRCSACGTVFRVVQDQLKVSEGWVRCGRCKEVFNALEGLFDLEREAAPQWQEAAEAAGEGHAAVSEPAPISVSGALRDPATEAPVDTAAGAIAFFALESAHESAFEASAADSESRDSQGFADARFNIELALEDERLAAEAAGLAQAPAEDIPAEQAPAVEAPAEPPPGFLRQAANEERWRRPGVRLALGVSALVLALALGAQTALHWRNLVAAQWPAVRPLLATTCAALGCRIEPPRRIEDIAVESSALTRAAPGASALRLTVGLRNRGPLALALPHLELSLTDANGELIARRALAAAEFRGAGPTLAPAGETSLQALLADPGGRVAGYTVEVFYP